MHFNFSKKNWILSIVLILTFSGCQLFSKLFVKKLPPLQEIAGNYYGIVQGNQTGFNSLVLHIDTLGNFTLAYMSNNQKVQQFQHKLKVNKDSSFNLIDSLGRVLIFKYNKGEATLWVKDNKHNAFENSKTTLEKTSLDFSKNKLRRQKLIALQGYYISIVEKSDIEKTDNWKILLRSDNSLHIVYPALAIENSIPFKSQDIILQPNGGYNFNFTINETNFTVNKNAGTELNLIVQNAEKKYHATHSGSDEIFFETAFLDGNWELISLKGHPISYMRFSYLTPSLLFQKFGKIMIGNDGCNEIFGSFNYELNNISLKGPLGQTKKYCQDTDDVTFKEMLTASNTFQIGGDTLNLYGPEGRLTFKKKQGQIDPIK